MRPGRQRGAGRGEAPATEAVAGRRTNVLGFICAIRCGPVIAALHVVTSLWAIGRKQRHKAAHALNGHSAKAGEGGGKPAEARDRRPLAYVADGGAEQPPPGGRPSRTVANSWDFVGGEAAWEAATSVLSVDLEVAASLASSYQTAGPGMQSPRTCPAADINGRTTPAAG